MMIKFILIFLLNFDLQASDPLFFYADSSLKIKKFYRREHETRISGQEKCGLKSCQAYLYASGKLKLPAFKKFELNGRNPSSLICEEVQGKAVVAYLSNRDEFSLCAFSDGSYIFGQDLLKLYVPH